MFYKFLKFLFLSTLTLVWGGCDTKDDAVAGYGCFPTKCYNTTATDKNGMTISIIECEDGTKYLRIRDFTSKILKGKKHYPMTFKS